MSDDFPPIATEEETDLLCEHEDVRRPFFVLLFCWNLQAASALLESRAEGKLNLPQRGEIRLFDFRPDSVRAWKISGASLLLFQLSGDTPKSLNVSTIDASWDEAKPEEAAGHIFHKTRTHSCAVKVLEQGWIQVTLPPALIEALANGKAFGLAIEQGPHKFNGRAPVFRQPYIIVDGEPR